MAREQPLFMRGDFVFDFDASDLTFQYTWVVRVNSTTQAGTGMGNVALAVCPAGAQAFGVIQQNGYLGEAGNVMQYGVSFAKVSTTAASGLAGDLLAVGPNGCLIKAATGAFAVAQAEENYNPGETTTVTVFPFGKQ